MKDLNKQITESVKDQSYFKDSFDFYATKYLYPVNIRTQLAILTIFLVIAAGIAVNMFIKNYVSSDLPFPIYAQDEVKYYPILKPLASKKEPIETSVADTC